MKETDLYHYKRLVQFALDHPVWAVVLGSLFLTLVILVAMVVIPIQKIIPSDFMYVRF